MVKKPAGEKKVKAVEAEVVTAEISTEVKTQALTPMTLIAKAMEGDFDVDKMTKLYELQQRFESDQAEKSFNAAIATFRAECPAIEKTKKGHNSKFAGLAETIEQIKPFTSKNGLSHYWDMEDREDGKIRVICFISHSEGHRKEVRSPWCSPDGSGNKTEIHSIGSIISYLERYTFFAGHGLASKEQDNDGGGSKPEPEVEYITDGQAMDLHALISEVEADEAKFLEYMTIVTKTPILEVGQIPAINFKLACKSLEAKR